MNFIRFKLLGNLLFVATLTLFVFVVIMNPLISLPISCLVLDGVVHGILLAILYFFLRDIVKYGKYSSLPFLQRTINYGALAVLFTVCWIGLGFGILYFLLSENDLSQFLPTLPVRIVMSLLIYAFLVVFYEYKFSRISDHETKAEEPSTLTEIIEQPNEEQEHLEPEVLEHIAIKNGQKIDVIFINDVICILAEGDYVMIHTSKGRFLKEQTMKFFADCLPKNKFVRIHRSSIINIDFIQRIELFEKQSQILKLQNNMQVKMSVTGYKELKKMLNL